MAVTRSITDDLTKAHYEATGGTLTLAWSHVPRFNAWAESNGSIAEPPQHKIVLNYELARQLYRDAELYLQFNEEHIKGEALEALFMGLEFASGLPRFFTREACVNNMFIGALTWVYWHELSHLSQEHGYIRRHFDSSSKAGTTAIEECEGDGAVPLQGRGAALSHVTELAADFEATNTCILELIRHFTGDATLDAKQDLTPFRSALFLLTCGISCACYRFYGNRPDDPGPIPTGSHPTPLRRLECSIPQLFEFLDIEGSDGPVFGLNRSELVRICSGAAYSCGLYFLGWLSTSGRIPDNYMMRGLRNDPHAQSYWSIIVETWDEIAPIIKAIRRCGAPFGLLRFSSDFRTAVLGQPASFHEDDRFNWIAEEIGESSPVGSARVERP